MAFWDNLGPVAARLGLAAEVSETSAKVEEGSAKTTLPAVPAAKVGTVPPPPADAARLAEIDKMARDRLVTAMQNDGAPLVEELSDHLDTLADAIPDEKARYMSALKLLAKKGGSAAAILSHFDKCLGCLDDNNRSFEADCNTQLETKVGSKTHEVESYDIQIKAKSDQIQALQNEIAALVSKKADTQSAITIEQAKIAQVQDRFTVVYRTVRGQIEAQRAKVAQYGQGS